MEDGRLLLSAGGLTRCASWKEDGRCQNKDRNEGDARKRKTRVLFFNGEECDDSVALPEGNTSTANQRRA